MHTPVRGHAGRPGSAARQALGFAAWLLASFAAAAVGGAAAADAPAFYAELVRPEWAPPAWLFAPVWTALYVLMAVAAWLVWRVGGFAAARGALLLFLAQLAANALWTWLFFAWRLGALAVAEILVLWSLVLATSLAFRRTSPLAATLLLPYLAWVTYASALTWALWRLNPGLQI
jgi:tryptophan-rich sensory protein